MDSCHGSGIGIRRSSDSRKNGRSFLEGNRITVAADCYAKSVEILNDNEDLLLSDNYFDLNGGEKTVEVLSGTIDHLRLRSVYDIS